MVGLTFEEQSIICLYSASGTRRGTIATMQDMRKYLQPDENELRQLTDSALTKLRHMTDAEFEAVDLCPNFDPEDLAYGG